MLFSYNHQLNVLNFPLILFNFTTKELRLANPTEILHFPSSLWETRHNKPRTQRSNHLHINETSHLISTILNAEWLTWTMKAPPKILPYDQKIAVQEVDGQVSPKSS